MLRQSLTLLSLVFLAVPIARTQEVKIGVLGLFHPRELFLRSSSEDGLVIKVDEKTFAMDSGTDSTFATIRISGPALVLELPAHSIRASEIRVTSRDQKAATFTLGVPGKITRRYRGILVVKAHDGVVVPIVTMDLETAVASVIAAESLPGTQIEALKAQAVVTRSYFFAGTGRHHDFDFCDLTHCQFLREPPPPGSDADIAASQTRGLVLRFEDKAIATMFARSCNGKTRTPAELKIQESNYPYFPVICDYCRKNPARWTRHISKIDAAQLNGKGEAGRLVINRRLGWNTIPSNNFYMHEEDGRVLLEGVGQGHGIGLCQRGARAMAEDGVGFREILGHYFPNTTLSPLETHSPS